MGAAAVMVGVASSFFFWCVHIRWVCHVDPGTIAEIEESNVDGDGPAAFKNGTK
jgi:hypothetical protein